MLVFLDTNVLVRDFSLKSTSFRLLFEGMLVIENLRVVVSQVVIDETVAKFVERLNDEYERERGATEKLARLLDQDRPLHERPADLGVQGGFYRFRLLERLRHANCEVAAYPQLDHKVIVQREVSRKAPFSSKGGYRDYLIWATVLERIAKHGPAEEFHLVTANSHDFGDAASLHADLAADLPKNVTVRVHSSIDSFNSECVRPHMQTVASTVASFANEDAKRELESWLERELSWYDDVKIDASFGFSDERDRARVRSTKIARVEADEKVKLANGNVWLEVNVSGTSIIDLATRIDDFVLQRDTIKAMQLDDVEPGEWQSTEECPFEAHISLIVNASTGGIEEGGVHSIRINGIRIQIDQGVSRPW